MNYIIIFAALLATLTSVSAPARADVDLSQTTDGREGRAELDPPALFRAATDALKSHRPADAIANFEALADRGVADPVASYNRGLAYAERVRFGPEQPGDLGRAAHGFEEARELSHDARLQADASSALTQIRAEVARRRSRAGDPVELDSGIPLGRSIVKLLPENAWAVLAMLASAALAVGIVVRGRARARRLAVAGSTTCAVAGGLLVLLAVSLSSARDTRRFTREAIVVAPSTRLLDEKHVALVSVAPLAEGARVQLLEDNGEFTRVATGRANGFLLSSTLAPMAK
jgi:hypothetical protein